MEDVKNAKENKIKKQEKIMMMKKNYIKLFNQEFWLQKRELTKKEFLVLLLKNS